MTMTTIQDAIVAINADLLVLGAPPLDSDQIECLQDPVFQDEAENMLDDLCARVGISTDVMELGLQALRARTQEVTHG